jgi:putative endonuclease
MTAPPGGPAPARHWSEPRVRRWLERRGWRTLACNVATRGGELDLVMLHGETIVFVEVRQRGDDARGGAAESLDGRKRARVRRAAAAWLAARGWHEAPVRFDAALVRGGPDGARVTLVRDAL